MKKKFISSIVLFLLLLGFRVYSAGQKEEEPYEKAEGTESWAYEYDISDLPDGKYNFVVKGQDAAGNDAIAGPYNFYIDSDSDLPTVSIAHPEEGIIVTGNMNIAGSAHDDDGISLVELSLDGSEYVSCGTADFWTFYLDLEDTSDGPHELSVRAVDINGLTGNSRTVSFSVDNKSPATEILSHENGSYLSDTVIITGTVMDSSGIESLSCREKDSENSTPLKLKYNKDEGLYTFSQKLSTKDYPDGPHDLQYRSIDRSGTEGLTSLHFFTDNTAPEITILNPLPGADVNEKILLAGKIEDTVGVQDLSCYIGDTEYAIDLIPGNPYWTSEVDLNELSFGALTLKFTAIDYAGNSSSSVLKIRNSEDSDKPDISIYTAEALGIDEKIVQTAFSTSDDDGVESIEYTLDEEQPVLIKNGNPSVIGFENLLPGKHTIRARAADINGRYGDMKSVSFNVPKIPEKEPAASVPELIIEQKSSPEIISDGITIIGRVESAEDLQISFRLPGTEENEWKPVDAGSGGSFSHLIPAAGLEDGQYVVELRAKSAAGNLSSTFVPFIKNSAGPQVRMLTPGEGDEINGKISISGIIQDNSPISTIELSDDGENFNSLSTNSYFSENIDFSSYEIVPPRIFIKATDIYGLSETYPLVINYNEESDIPVTDIQFPFEGMVVSSDFSVTGTAIDDDGIAKIHYLIDDGEWAGKESGSSFSVPVKITALDDGEHTIRIKCEDFNAVTSTIAEKTFIISRTDPVTRILAPRPEEYVNGMYTISGTSEDPNGIREVFVSTDNGSSYNRATGAEEWQYDLDTDILADGTYSIYVKAVDNAGEDSFYTSILNIDNTGPNIKLDSPLPNGNNKSTLTISGRISDNVTLKTIKCTLKPLDDNVDPASRTESNIEPDERIEHLIDISGLIPGWYNLNIEAADTAGNISYETRNIRLSQSDDIKELKIIYPLEGETCSVFTRIEGFTDSDESMDSVLIAIDNVVVDTAQVRENGYFSLLLDNSSLSPGEHVLEVRSNRVDSETKSAQRRFVFTGTGPWILFDGLYTGDYLTERGFISGKTGYEAAVDTLPSLEKVEVSFDNGRTFEEIEGKKILSKRNDGNWQLRIETEGYPDGNLPVLARAIYSNGSSANAKMLLNIDKSLPDIYIESPAEGSEFNESMKISGTSEDKNGMTEVAVLMRTGDKNRYEVPSFIQGLYLDFHAFGATYGELGLGLTFFDDNVKLQAIIGAAPPGRFTGLVMGGKLLANVASIPYDYLFGPDWQKFSMAFALGANFSYFTMSEDSYSFTDQGVILGSVLGQWEFLRYNIPHRKSFHTYSMYMEGSLWFISSDVQAGLIPRLSIGVRLGIL